MDAITVSDNFARLAPWLSTLRLLTPPAYGWPAFPDDFIGPRVLWFAGDQLYEQPTEANPLQSYCEALSLLALLARADLQAWKKTVQKIWPQERRFKELLERMEPSERFAVGLGLSALTPSTIGVVAWFAGYNTTAITPSEEYVKLRQEWEAKLKTRGEEDDDHATIRVTLELDCCDGNTRAAASMLQRSLDLVKLEQKHQKSTSKEDHATKRPRFKVTNVDFATTVGVKIGLAGLKALQQLSKLGIRLSHLPPLEVETTLAKTPPFIQMLRDVTCLDDTETLGARTVTINDQDSPTLIRSLLTTVQHSSKVEVVELNLGNGDDLWFPDQSDVWQWVAFTLFSGYANHNIDTLELHAENLQTVEVDAIRRVLEARNPFAAAIDPGLTLLPESTPHQITASRFFLEGEDCDPQVPFKTRRPITVRVLQSPVEGRHPYWSVLFPGHHIVAVHVDDVLSSSTSELHLENRQATAMPSFRQIDIIKIAENSMEPVADLLALIGKETQRIDLYEQLDDAPVDRWCHRVLASCPRLEELLVRHAQVDDLTAFVAAAAKSECRLRELSLCIVPTGDTDQHVRVFFDALSNPNHALSTNLRQLDIGLYVETDNADDIINPVLRMLRQNRRLCNLDLTIKLPSEAKSMKAAMETAFEELSEQVVSIRTAPLGLACKLAFLSVVDHCFRNGGTRGVGHLDASLLTTVFQFAAHGRARLVHVKYGELRRMDEDQDEEFEGEGHDGEDSD